MTRDYKHVSDRRATTRSAPAQPKRGFRAGFTLGLTLGLGGAVLVHFYYVLRDEPALPPVPVETRAASPAAEDEKPYDYDFYRILADLEVSVPEPEEGDEELRPVYILQVGSFKARHTAEVLQGRLKTLDLESKVHKVERDDGAVWYGVRLGPYDSLSRVNNIRIDLRKRGIDSMLKKR